MVKPAIVALCLLGMHAGLVKSGDTRPDEAMAEKFGRLFNDMSLVDKGQFGASRIPNDPFNSHPNRGAAPIQLEVIDLLKQIRDQGYDYEEGLISNLPEMPHPRVAHFTRADTRLAYWRSVWKENSTLFPPYNRSMLNVSPALNEFAKKVDGHGRVRRWKETLRGFDILATPIKFEHAECMSCHTSAHVGDTAAIFVTAMRHKTPA